MTNQTTVLDLAGRGRSTRSVFKRAAISLIFVAILLGVRSADAQTIQSTSLTLVSPARCPNGGCAAGQTLDIRASYDLGEFDPALNLNVQVCFYAPTNWAVEPGSLLLDLIGGITGAGYQADTSHCTSLTGYNMIGGVSAKVPENSFGDVLNLSFRLGKTADQSGSLVMRVYEQVPTGNWPQTGQTFAYLIIKPTSTSVYVANDASACGSFSPCYVNSARDAAGGIGTGLKDAVDAGATTITILGSYPIKGSTVLIDRLLQLQGQDDARITYQGADCSQPMLRLAAGVTLRDLTITDGNCLSPSRTLLEVNSAEDVTLEYLDLIAGLNAIHVIPNSGNVTVRFSQILNNAGYALVRESSAGGGTVQLTGNNIYGNRGAAQVDCAGKGTADHNFWGVGVTSSDVATNCAANDLKQLGAPALPRSEAAGVDGELVTVGSDKKFSFGGLVSYQRSGGSDFNLYLINHGAGAPENVPFTGGSPGNLVPCSNYYDIFLASDPAPAGTLALSLRYDRTPGCTATIESTDYCSSPEISRYPLWWYSTAATDPKGWNKTGSTGQATTCDLNTNEITVAIDASGRPYLDDLSFTPFVVGLPAVQSSVVFTHLEAIPGNGQATIKWSTASEVNTAGFYLLRSDSPSGGFSRVSFFIPARGSSVSGANYEQGDSGLTNGKKYFYRLEIISSGQQSSFSQVIDVTPGPPTLTATVTTPSTTTTSITSTPTHTATVTPTGSITATATPTRTRTATRVPTRTRTPVRYATYYTYRSPTPMPTRTSFPTRTSTITATFSDLTQNPTASLTLTQLSSITLTTTLSITERGTGYPPPQGSEATQIEATSTLAGSAMPTRPGTPAPGGISGRSGWQRYATFGQRNWPWLLGLLGFELIAVVGTAFYLYKHGLLTLPARKSKDDRQDPPL